MSAMVEQADVAESKSQVQYEIENQAQVIQELHDTLAALEARLVSVIRLPDIKAAEVEKVAREPVVPLADTIRHHSDEIVRAHARVATLLYTVEV